MWLKALPPQKARAHKLPASSSFLVLPKQENLRPKLAPAHFVSAAAVVPRPAPLVLQPLGSRSAEEVAVQPETDVLS